MALITRFYCQLAKTEVVAKFVSETLFTDKAENNSEIAADFLAELRRVDRAWYERFIDWVKSVFARLKETDAVNKDIIKLEQKFLRLVETVDRNNDSTGQIQNSRERYWVAEDKALYNYINDALLGKLPKKSYYKISEQIPKRLARDIEKIVGFSVVDYGNEISPGNIVHIENEHGAKGITDNSMKDHHDLARISFVINNYEKIAEGKLSHEYKNSDGTYAKTVVLQKKINDDFYYVVEAVPDAKLKSLHIVSAYKNKKDTFPEVPVSKDPRRYVQDEHQSNVSNNSIPNSTEKVNQYSFAGEKAKTADKIQLTTAKQMLKDGVDSETIRQETGWFKGYDGKWRFEISDNKLRIRRSLYENAIISGQYINALRRRAGVKASKEETARFLELLKKYSSLIHSQKTLGDYIEHKQLFEAYPELKDIKLVFGLPKKGWAGTYSYDTKTIELNCDILYEEWRLEKTLIHEIQHAIQHIEGFNRGSSNVYWDRIKAEGKEIKDKEGIEISPSELYKRTAGEIEARESSERIFMYDEERKSTRPDIDRADVVFVEDYDTAATGGMPYSIPSDHTFVYNQGKASFTEQRLSALLDEHSLGDGKRAEHSNAYVGYISPEEFLKLTANDKIRGRVEDEAYVLNEKELERESETPFLEYDPSNGRVVNHEGRHRMVALKAEGIISVAIVLKPSDDSFKPRTKRDISLTGQSFADSNASGKVTVKNALPLSEKYRNQITAEFAKNPDADIRYSIPGKITPNMSEQDRAEVLRVGKLDIVEHKMLKDGDIDFVYLEKAIKSKAEKILLKKLKDLGYLRHYTTNSVDIEFDFTMGGLRKSIHSQLEYGGDYSDFARVVINLQELLDSAVLIESHTDKAVGTLKENPQLKQVYVLLSALKDGNSIIPVQFEIKQFVDDNNRLYLTVALTKIETGVMGNTIPDNSQVSTNLLPVSTISIPELFSKINPIDKKFLKYVPDEFLNDLQKSAKKEALREDDIKYGGSNPQYSIPENAIGKSRAELKAMVESGEITLDEAFESLTDQYGTLPKGENPKVDVSFPKKISKNESVSRFARTVAESGHLDQGMSERQQKELLDGAFHCGTLMSAIAIKECSEKRLTDI